MGEAKLFACLQWPNIVSGVKREFHAPFWEGLGVKFPRATRHERLSREAVWFVRSQG